MTEKPNESLQNLEGSLPQAGNVTAQPSLNDRSLQTLAPAFTVGIVIALVFLFAPWYTVEDPFFGLPATVNAFEAKSPVLEMWVAYPLIALYAIGFGSIWATRTGHLSLGVGLPLSYISLLAGAYLILNMLLTLFEIRGQIHYGLWGSFAFTLIFGLWALVHDTFFKPRKGGAES